MSTNQNLVKKTSDEIIKTSSFSQAETELIRQTCAKNTTDIEFAHFLRVAQMRGLNPLANQFHCIVRGQGEGRKATHQVAIDGFRVIAERSGVYAGSDDAVFEPGDVEQYRHPASATVTIWKIVAGVRCPFTATARWAEYKPSPGKSGNADQMWRKMPFGQLAKCAEALALRKAFPQDLSGLYEPSELDQMEEIQPEPKSIKQASASQEWKCAPDQIPELLRATEEAGEMGIKKMEMKQYLPEGVNTRMELNEAQAEQFLKELYNEIHLRKTAERSLEEEL